MGSDDKKPTMGHLSFGPGMGGGPPTATNAPISIDASKHFCEHGRPWTRDCEKCDQERDDEIREEGRRIGIEEAAKLMEENAERFHRSKEPEKAYQLAAEARHIRELAK